MSDPKQPPVRIPISFVPIAALFIWLIGIAFQSRFTQTAPLDFVVLALAYLLLACASLWGLGWLGSLNKIYQVAGAVVLSPLFVWHFREVVRIPDSKRLVPLACGVAAIVLYFLATMAGRGIPRRRLGIGTAASCLATLIVIATAYLVSPSLRFEMMRNHTLLGYPTWATLGVPTETIEKDLWNEHSTSHCVRSQAPINDVQKKKQPSIVFILIDTLRRDSLSAYGGDPALMPHLNAFAGESIVFQDVLANASWTRPSIGSMFTGLYQEYHGAVGRENALARSNNTLAEILAARGYETAAFVTNWGAVGKDAGFDQGFDTFRECHPKAGPYLRAHELTREVENWLKHRNGDAARSERPLFLYVHYLDPHMPYLSGGRDSNRFKVAREAYLNEIAFLDIHLDRLIQSTDRMLEGPVSTLIVSDHGEEFGEHGQKGHGFSLYQEVTRIPAMIRTPDHRAATVAARLEGRDVFGLVLHAAADAKFDASSWGRSKDKPRRYTSEYLRTDVPMYRPEYRHVSIRAIEREGLFFIESALGPTLEIYDRTGDPQETRNLIRSHRDLLPSLRHDLEEMTPAPWVDRKSVRLGGDSLKQLEALGYIDLD